MTCPPPQPRPQAEEVLKSARGALMWHGRDMRHFKRILPPPLQQLLTRPGTAVLGRGLASMPAEAAHQMGAAQVRGAAGAGSSVAACSARQGIINQKAHLICRWLACLPTHARAPAGAHASRL